MVLQRNTKIKIWGWATPGENISVNFDHHTFHAHTAENGTWSVNLPSLKHGGPFTMEITASNKIVVNNIMVGDVWVCSGQSNMALTMERVKDQYPNIIAQANNTSIRHFFIPTTYHFEKRQADLPAGKWEEATKDNILRFSAVAYFFAKTLYEKYQVPIGLINSSVGGSPAEAWLSEEMLKKFPEHLAIANKFKNKKYADSIRANDNASREAWYSNVNKQDSGLTAIPNWYQPALNDRTWNEMNIPGYWDEEGLKDLHGAVWFRKKVQVPASMAGKPARLFLGNVIDQDSVFINGIFTGTTGYQYPPRKYIVPASTLKAGENDIVVRVINNSGRGGFYRGKPYLLKIENDTIDLSGKWKYRVGQVSPVIPPSTTFQYQPGGLFNGMIAPLLHYSITGVIWYQGESNTKKPAEYESLFRSVIKDWRTNWSQGEFPFLYVQLANFMQTYEQPSESNWAAVRESQRKTLSTANTAMVVAIDVGEWNDIHPLNKKTIGERLALAAEKIAYRKKNIVHSGPILKSYSKHGNKIILTFSNTGSGLVSKGGQKLKYFSIAGPDKKFVWAEAVIKGDEIIVWSDQVDHPVVVRYAWADNPEGANLYNVEGLPASPFSTE
jgi:sialate O-acetylesterase